MDFGWLRRVDERGDGQPVQLQRGSGGDGVHLEEPGHDGLHGPKRRGGQM